jgi:hypothetical protein
MLVDVHHDRRGRIHTRIALSNNRVQGIGANWLTSSDAAHDEKLDLVGVCVNRIGMIPSLPIRLLAKAIKRC